MILPDFKAFPHNGRLLGVDWGQRRIGLAVSDINHDFVFVRPGVVLSRGADNHANLVADFAKKESVVGIVVGLPLHADGSDSNTTKQVRNFIDTLSEITDLPICTIEENLTSVVAQENMGRVSVSEIKENLDSESARVILENAIAMIKRA